MAKLTPTNVALEYFKKGKYDKALNAYLELLREKPYLRSSLLHMINLARSRLANEFAQPRPAHKFDSKNSRNQSPPPIPDPEDNAAAEKIRALFKRDKKTALTQNSPPIPELSRDEQKNIIRDAFDLDYYIHKYNDMAHARMDKIEHFYAHGARELRNPSPFFNTKYYVSSYRNVVDFNLINPFCHFLVIGRTNGFRPNQWCYGDPLFDSYCTEVICQDPAEIEDYLLEKKISLICRFRGGALRTLFNETCQLEPLIGKSYLSVLEYALPPFHSQKVVEKTLCFNRLCRMAEFKTADVVICLPHCRLSGASKIGGYLTKAIANLDPNLRVVLIITDKDIFERPEWFPKNITTINYAKVSSNISESDNPRVLAEFLRSLRPSYLFNVNSSLLWMTIIQYGKQLKDLMKTYSYLFCSDKDIYGNEVGYPVSSVHTTLQHHTSFITDSLFLRKSIIKKYFIPKAFESKIISVATPIEASALSEKIPRRDSSQSHSFIYWAGRLDRQKRVDIFYQVARLMPNYKFLAWGEAVVDKNYESRMERPDNVSLSPSFKSLRDINLERCSVWLYTSEWDGTPNMVLEVISKGIPVVASNVGGVAEAFIDNYSYLVDQWDSPTHYVDKITSVINNYTDALFQIEQSQRRLIDTRKEEIYSAQIATLLGATNSDQ